MNESILFKALKDIKAHLKFYPDSLVYIIATEAIKKWEDDSEETFKVTDEAIILAAVDKMLLDKAKELNLYVDFSDKTYDGDKSAPMDRIGLLDYFLKKWEDSSGKETGMKWVDVKDRLPDVGEGEATEVIINSHVEDAPDKDVSLCGIFYKGDFYVCANWEGGNPEAINPIRKGRVSHWMPIPELSQSVPPYKEEVDKEEYAHTFNKAIRLLEKAFLKADEPLASDIYDFLHPQFTDQSNEEAGNH